MDYLRENRDLVTRTLGHLPGVKIAKLEATYLAWIDVSGLQLDDPIATFEAGGVGLSPGAQFGDKRFVRLNFGCSRPLLQQALERMVKVIQSARLVVTQ